MENLVINPRGSSRIRGLSKAAWGTRLAAGEPHICVLLKRDSAICCLLTYTSVIGKLYHTERRSGPKCLFKKKL